MCVIGGHARGKNDYKWVRIGHGKRNCIEWVEVRWAMQVIFSLQWITAHKKVEQSDMSGCDRKAHLIKERRDQDSKIYSMA